MRSMKLVLQMVVGLMALGGCAKSPDGVSGGDGAAGAGGARPGDAGMDAAGGAGGGMVTDGGLHWFTTCGDPVCRTGPDAHREMPDVAPCSTQKAGQPCTTKDQTCDPRSDCNEALRCTDHDPKMQPGGCPISSRRFKEEITYLTEADRMKIADDVARFRLARYKYTDDPAGRPHLGFILEDAPDSPATDLRRERVDLYAYLSMVVATVQTQNETLKVQARELRSLRRELARLRRQ